jgi:hypothetical protein
MSKLEKEGTYLMCIYLFIYLFIYSYTDFNLKKFCITELRPIIQDFTLFDEYRNIYI